MLREVIVVGVSSWGGLSEELRESVVMTCVAEYAVVCQTEIARTLI